MNPNKSVAWKLALAVVLEVAYALSTRVWLKHYFEGTELELYTTGIRILTAASYWLLFRELIWSRTPRLGPRRHPLFVGGVVLVLLVPVIVGDWKLSGQSMEIVFALTSVVVGFREEILYRGVLQNVLQRRTGWIGAILLSNVIFTFYHYGAWPFTLHNVLEFFLVGSSLGFIYYGTGSIWLAIAVHSIYDALWSFSPLIAQPLARSWGTWIELLAFALLALWAWTQSRPGNAAHG